jgi:hypothetical protein
MKTMDAKTVPCDAKTLALGFIERGIARDAETLAHALGVMPQTARSLLRELEAAGALGRPNARMRSPGCFAR